ncbi:hypothetical protein [Corynebacterium sp. TAE3-ERU2]|uniref:hypothetical protein n=1 Tax=Corynebacterium sp. TAE3-ERU2 TaxID=2849497 RepID=UPI001C46AB28|nr:hypothetical protein [Corynebacterium sp. TAE3-ERU2]MBV7302945.1 hypothetical protein [Corynebacterium sp. TAE3-ERU2]
MTPHQGAAQPLHTPRILRIVSSSWRSCSTDISASPEVSTPAPLAAQLSNT